MYKVVRRCRNGHLPGHTSQTLQDCYLLKMSHVTKIWGETPIVLNSYTRQYTVRMAEWSKVLRSGRSPLLWAWVRIPLLTNIFPQNFFSLRAIIGHTFYLNDSTDSRVAQWKRAGPITQRSVDRNYALLTFLSKFLSLTENRDWAIFIWVFNSVRMAEWSKAPDSRYTALLPW